MAGMDRRQVLKAAGVTSTIPFASGLGAASGATTEAVVGNSERVRSRTASIRCSAIRGLEGDGQLPEPLQPDHEVDLETRPQEGTGAGVLLRADGTLRRGRRRRAIQSRDAGSHRHRVPSTARSPASRSGGHPAVFLAGTWNGRVLAVPLRRTGVYDVLCAPRDLRHGDADRRRGTDGGVRPGGDRRDRRR